MKKSFKKLVLAAAGVVAVLALAGCSNSKTVVSMKGGKITESEYYEKMKKTTSGQSTLQTMIITKALEDQYGSKVSSKKVDAQYNKFKKTYGSSLSSVLSSNGMTKADLKENIRTNYLTEAALKANKKVTEKNLETQWKSYEPKVTVAHILVAKEDTAKDIIKQLDEGGDFTKLAKKYSTDTATKSNGGKLSAFDNTDTSLDSDFKAAAFKLKQGEYTKTPVKTTYGYHIIKMIKNPGKGKMADHKKELTKQLYDSWLQDSSVMQKVLAKVIKKANVSIKDKDLQNVLSSYVSTSSSSSK
ncbi:peptidylprolyl isomerase [Lapidilactobacillus wuchangensis]|uniref:peptidylprolyl isomerase n=1 Tax=Lapidilactobacillus wuchangensis TaxID=2486001 RepID=UPI000F773474|nr:peptidylprolyl isomerase [Lapidilactobacillus wuchangensis]